MEFTEVVRQRRMVRNFDPDKPVPRPTLERVLHNGVRAPSAGFSQGWDFVVLTEPEDRSLYWKATTDRHDEPTPWLRGMMNSTCLILCCSDKNAYLRRYAEPDKGWSDMAEERWPVPYWDVDTGMAALLMLLTGVDEGLGGVFFGVPPGRAEEVRTTFDIPADRNLVGVVAIGYPAPDRRSPSLRRGRRKVEQVAHFGRFGRHA